MVSEAFLASSPESVPSLAGLSQVSTDGTDGGDSARMDDILSDVPSPSFVGKSPLSRDSSWRAILDDDEDETQADEEEEGPERAMSTCSSGILSSETFDLSFHPKVMEGMDTDSLHSLASMKTVKTHSGRSFEDPSKMYGAHEDGTQAPNPTPTAQVDPEDIPPNRACHGALAITPKQLAEVFALFSKESKSQAKVSEEPKESEFQPAFHVEPAVHVSPPASRTRHADYPMSLEERQRYRRPGGSANQPKLTAELYWKPRAKSLEKECETLKEILSDDSSKILQLKGALDTLRNDKMKSLVDIKSYQEQNDEMRKELDALKKELDVLKKEREMLLERETEHCETIRILKNEVDILTRDEKRHKPAKKRSPPPKQNSADRDELEQLRLENQLFATQIVDYEAELERLEKQVQCTTGKEQQDTREAMRAYELARSISQLERLSKEQSEEMGADACDLEEEIQCLSQTPLPEEQFVEATLSSKDSEDIVVTTSSTGEESVLASEGDSMIVDEKAVDEEEGMNDTEGGKEAEADGGDEGNEQERSLGRTLTGLTNDFNQQILGNVLGMFTVGGSTDGDGKEIGGDEVFVLHEAAPTAQSKDIAHCLQWKSPDELPTFVKVDQIVPLDKVEDRNPPSSPSQGPLSDKTNVSSPTMRNMIKQHEEDRCAGRDGTAIEVHQNSDASQSIEVQLTDSGKEKANSGGVKAKRDENCDMWSVLSGCPFASDDEEK